MRQKIIRYIDIISNIKWEAIFWLNYFLKSNFRDSMHDNRKYRYLHKNKRCFVVGNAPSLLSMNLSVLKNEIVFTVNDIVRNEEIYSALNSDYHVVIDPDYFKESHSGEPDTAIVDLITRMCSKQKSPTCFVPYESMKFIRKYKLDELLQIGYLFQHRILLDSSNRGISIDRNAPCCQNVVQAAIVTAIHMGFKEVYLIGCDMTSLFQTFEFNVEGERQMNVNSHVYTVSEEERGRAIRYSAKYDNEYMLRNYSEAFSIFKVINKVAKREGVKIINATRGGGLDVFERRKFHELFES